MNEWMNEDCVESGRDVIIDFGLDISIILRILLWRRMWFQIDVGQLFIIEPLFGGYKLIASIHKVV